MNEAGTCAKWNEGDRLAALRSYGVLDTPPEPAFDSLAQLAAHVCGTPFAAINLIEDRRQWSKAEVGLGFRETPVEVSICAKAILQQSLFIIADTSQDSRFASNPLVTGPPHVRFYAGALLFAPQSSLPLGTLCVLDRQPRELNEQQSAALTTLAAQVMSQLELRRMKAERDEALASSREAEQRQALLSGSFIIGCATHWQRFRHYSEPQPGPIAALMSSTAPSQVGSSHSQRLRPS